MAKKNKEKRRTKIVKLGENALNFCDTATGFNLASKEVKEVDSSVFNTPKFKTALSSGHLSLASSDELEEFNEGLSVKPASGNSDKEVENLRAKLKNLEEDLKEKDQEIEDLKASSEDAEEPFKGYTKDNLITYYEENFDLDEDELKRFSKLTREEMVNELTEEPEE